MGADGMDERIQEPAVDHQEKILVSVRLRPLNAKQIASHDVSDWECLNDKTIEYKNNLPVSERSMYPNAYSFDRVFSPDCSTRQVYEEGAKKVALSVVTGINSSVFAYGQTSSGKTYTMRGVTHYAFADVYDYIVKHEEREFVMTFSAMEIYNESVKDLLAADNTPLRLLDDPEKGTVVEKLTEETLRDWNHFQELISICEAQRQIGETAMNDTSSRSHQILRLTVESSVRELRGNDELSSLSAAVNFVDLAGSERASQTLSAGARLKEGCHINRSLLTLSTVIRKLSKGRNGHIPFRDSKLTRILQSSLGGHARVAIICTMSPARSHVEQSRNTLLFASCAKEVATNAQVNVVMSDKALVKQLKKEVSRLETELRNSGASSTPAGIAELLREKDLEIEKLKEEIIELRQQRDIAHMELEDVHRASAKDGWGEERSPKIWVGVGHPYPRLRVRNSWDDILVTESPIFAAPRCECSDRLSCSSEESFLQLPDYKLNMFRVSSSSCLSPKTPNFNVLLWEENEELTNENIDDLCKAVQCVDSERSSENRYTDLNLSESGQMSQETNVNELSITATVITSESTDVKDEHDQNEENRPSPLEEQKESNKVARYIDSERSSENLYSVLNLLGFMPDSHERNIDASSPTETAATLESKSVVSNEHEENKQSGSSPLEEQKETSKIGQIFLIPTPEKQSSQHLDKVVSSYRSLKLPRSRTCVARFMIESKSEWFEGVENIENTSTGCDKDFTGRPESFQRALPSLKYDLDGKMLIRTGGHSYSKSVATSEPITQNVTIQAADTNTGPGTSAADSKEMPDLLDKEQLTDEAVQATNLEPIQKNISVRDGSLASVKDYMREFKRLQKEIIQLWHACNISLVHRAYFFLLFKGDPKDHIYMEVELRRLSFLKDTFAQGDQTLENGHTLTLASSAKALRHERHMLSHRMKKRLSKEERENIFLRWGIGLNTKHRRLQLAFRLWTETNDMDHVAESATIVARLVHFVDQEKSLKEMFGLSFAPGQHINKKHRSLRRSVMSIL